MCLIRFSYLLLTSAVNAPTAFVNTCTHALPTEKCLSVQSTYCMILVHKTPSNFFITQDLHERI